MPQRRLRMALYSRESDPRLADSTTIESAAQAARAHGEKQGYLYDPDLDFREAISSVEVPYFERPELQKMLDAARKGLFDVLIVTEIRAISRRQVEVLVIYDQLLKYGVRLETVKEKFGEDAMSKAILSLRAMFVEIEVEQSRMRMERGKRDRVIIGQAPKVATIPYTHILVDTEREVKGKYVLNTEVVYNDGEKDWTRIDVTQFFCDLLMKGTSLRKTCWILNDMGIPTAKGKKWVPMILRGIVSNPIIYGQPYANRYGLVKAVSPRSGKETYYERLRPPEEWIPLPPCDPVISRETYDRIQFQLGLNKTESIRNNRLQTPGLLRSGYIFCGICGGRMSIYPPTKSSRKTGRYYNTYNCRKKTGENNGHRTQISENIVHEAAKQKIAETVKDPSFVRAKVAEMRKKLQPIIDLESVHKTIADIDQGIQNFLELARHATTSGMIASLAQQMNELENQKRSAEKLLYAIEDDEAAKAEIEAELVRFEQWTEEVRPLLTDPTYLEKASYEELRLAVRIIGIRVTVWPTSARTEQRFFVDVTVPEVMKKIYSDSGKPCPLKPTAQ